MSWVFGAVAVSLGAYLLWGLLAPRSHWRALGAWSVADQHASEPSGASYGWRRLLSALGLLGIVVVVIVASAPGVMTAMPRSPRVSSAIQTMWGSPEPTLVERVVDPVSDPPAGLAPMPVLAYQDLDLESVPSYLLTIHHFTRLGRENLPGEIGSLPKPGISAVGSAELLLNVRGPVLCIPREAVVVETDTTVQVAVYYGLPAPAPLVDSDTGEHLEQTEPDYSAVCSASDPLTASVLIPVSLDKVIGDRKVVLFDGSSVRKVSVAR